MPANIPDSTLAKFTSFGDLLRFLRRHAGLTQMELSIAVGYSDAQICRLEQNLRLPDPPTIEARFVPALYLEDEPRAVSRLLELAANVRREDAPEPGLCPYKGLACFDEADASLFVGRESLTDKLVKYTLSLAADTDKEGEKFLAVVGASGSGKSSLVRAGLVPALRWNKISANWQIHLLTPTAHPLESLATTLTQDLATVISIESMMDDLSRDNRSLALYIKQGLQNTHAPIHLLIIDQFEELFALCHSEEERAAFINAIMFSVAQVEGKTLTVIILRADFYAHCARYPQLRHALSTHQEYIGNMSDEEMRRAIEEPARRGHWEFEPGLIDLILHDVGHEPGALPLLSHALLETWQRRHGRLLTLSGYTSAGGVRGAIAETAEAVFTDQFTHAQQAIARRIFLRLTELGDETATGDTRRRATYNELILKPEESAATEAVLKALADARLVTTSEDSVEVAHEALIREWPTLRGWLEDNRQDLRLHRQLTEAAQDWLAAERESDLLFRGVRLAEVKEWAAGHYEDMNSLEGEFLAAAVAASEKEAADREAARQHELETAQKLAEAERLRAEEQAGAAKRIKRRSLAIAGAGIVILVLAVLSFIAWQRSASQSGLNRSLSLASSAQLANQAGQGDAAMALALQAVQIEDPPSEALLALRKVTVSPGTRFILEGHSHAVQAVSISPDNHLALSGSCASLDTRGICTAGELILWDLDTQTELRRWTAHSGWVTAVTFSPDGQILISSGEDGRIILWDAASGEEIQQMARLPDGIVGLAVVTGQESGSGALMAGSKDGTVNLYELPAGIVLREFDDVTGSLTCLAIASNVPRGVTGYADGSLAIWDLNTGQLLGHVQGSGNPLAGIAISPDGSFILMSSGTTVVQVDSQSGKVTATYSTGGILGHVMILPDAKSAFVVIAPGLIQFDTENLQEKQMLMSGSDIEEFNPFTISQDGRLGIAGHTDGTLRVWNLIGALDYRTYKTGLPFTVALALSTDGKSVVVGDSSGQVPSPVIWDIPGQQIVKRLEGFSLGAAPDSVAISPDSRYVLAGGGNVTTSTPDLVVWDLDSGKDICHLEGNYRATVRGLAISPDGQSLLAGSQSTGEKVSDPTQELILWDIPSCKLIRQFEMSEKEDVTGVAFNSDGSLAATGTAYSKRVILWDVKTGRELKRFELPKYSGFTPIFDVAFGPDDRTLLAPGLGTIYLWDIDSATIIRQFKGSTDLVWSVDISPDYRYVLSGSNNGEVILWDYATGEEVYQLPAHSLPVMSVQFSLDGKYAYSISTDGLLSQWKIPGQQSLAELTDWAYANRYIRDLTCEERQRYRVEPLCEGGNP